MMSNNKRWLQLAGLLQEQDETAAARGHMRDLHVFDFDDTLGVTESPTLVAAVEYNGGDPEDLSSYTPIQDLVSRVGSMVAGVKTPNQTQIDSPGISGDKVHSNDELDSSQAIVLDTEQYRDWKEKYIPSGNHVRLVINPNIATDIINAGKRMFNSGVTGEIHVADFSPSSTIGGSVVPITQMLDRLASAEGSGAVTAVVTARKGETDLDTLGGGKIKAQNAPDIRKFIQDETGVAPDYVYGAADFNPSDPASAKRDLILQLGSKEDIDNIHFYDDDPENARKVAELCDEPMGIDGKEIEIFNYEFSKGANPSNPTFSCQVGEESIEEARILRLSESLLRKLIRITLVKNN